MMLAEWFMIAWPAERQWDQPVDGSAAIPRRTTLAADGDMRTQTSWM
jgi:hypothetical protein